MGDERGAGNDAQILTIMTTEHYNLQTLRVSTISEASGRSSLFLGAVSSSLVALSFVAQASGGMGAKGLSEAFYVFAFVLLPSLFFLGFVAFARAVEVSSDDVIYARGIARIRHYYTEVAPQMQDYFILGMNDDAAGAMRNMGMLSARVQPLLTTSGTIAVLDSILAGAFSGLLLSHPFGAPLAACVATGIAAFAGSLAVHLRLQTAHWRRASAGIPVLFPSEPGEAAAPGRFGS